MAAWLKKPGNREAANAARRAAYRADPSKWAQSGLASHKRDPAGYLYRTAKSRALRKGIPFSITIFDIEVPTHCPVLGLRLEVRPRGGKKDHSMSLDRIDCDKGYVPGNIVVISHKANQLKSNGKLREHALLVRWLTIMQRQGHKC